MGQQPQSPLMDIVCIFPSHPGGCGLWYLLVQNSEYGESRFIYVSGMVVHISNVNQETCVQIPTQDIQLTT